MKRPEKLLSKTELTYLSTYNTNPSNLSIHIKDLIVDTENLLQNPKASYGAKKVMNYLKNEVYGKKILTGVMECAWSNPSSTNYVDMDKKILDDTGYKTALKGFDFMNMTKGSNYNSDQIELAKQCWNEGRLVTFCWHWRDPMVADNRGNFYTPASKNNNPTYFKIPYENGKLKTSSMEFTAIKKDLDTVASYLDELQKADIPVIWRPLHEARGAWGETFEGADAWFWWGANGPEAYKALWIYMYDYFTNTKKLNNLIWIWNGQGEQWYPGDKYCDLVGYDIYDDANKNGAGQSYYNNLMNWCKKSKMAAVSECGYVPSTNLLKSSSTNWLWYMVWNDNDNLSDDTYTDNDNFWGGTRFNSLKSRTNDSFYTNYQIKLGDESLASLFESLK